MTDGDNEVIEIAKDNILLNSVNLSSKVMRFVWDDDETSSLLLQSTPDNNGFDVIIASDCLYKDCLIQAKKLFTAVSKLLSKNKTKTFKDSNIENTKEGDSNGGGWQSIHSESDEVSPVFILGFTRRMQGSDASIEDILEVADKFGFEWTIADDYVIDMFGNETSERTLFWEHCIFLFTWKESFLLL